MALAALLQGCAHRAPKRVEIDIRGMAFSPARVEVSAGDTIVWTNHDIVPHTATAEGFDTGSLSQGASGRFVAASPGTLPYVCNFHPTMSGEIVVR